MSESLDQESIIASASFLVGEKAADVCVCVWDVHFTASQSVCLCTYSSFNGVFFCVFLARAAFYVFVQRRVLMGAFLLRADK